MKSINQLTPIPNLTPNCLFEVATEDGFSYKTSLEGILSLSSLENILSKLPFITSIENTSRAILFDPKDSKLKFANLGGIVSLFKESTELGDLSNTLKNSIPTDASLLSYNSSTSTWEATGPKQIPARFRIPVDASSTVTAYQYGSLVIVSMSCWPMASTTAADTLIATIDANPLFDTYATCARGLTETDTSCNFVLNTQGEIRNLGEMNGKRANITFMLLEG